MYTFYIMVNTKNKSKNYDDSGGRFPSKLIFVLQIMLIFGDYALNLQK